MNFNEYTKIMHSLIDSVYEEFKRDDTQELSDIVHETVDGDSWVIYYGRAWELVGFVRQSCFSEYIEANNMLSDIGEHPSDIDTLMTQLAYWIMYNNVYGAVYERLEKEEE